MTDTTATTETTATVATTEPTPAVLHASSVAENAKYHGLNVFQQAKDILQSIKKDATVEEILAEAEKIYKWLDTKAKKAVSKL